MTKVNHVDLKPCPFCSNTDNLEAIGSVPPIYFIKCYSCHAMGPIRESETLAVKAWNKRTPPGSYREARGAIPWQPGDEPAEDAIRRVSRGGTQADDLAAWVINKTLVTK